MSKYENKYFSVLGDSISTLEGYTTPDWAAYYDTQHKLLSGVLCPVDTWWGQVIKHFGGELLVNNSFSGSTVTRRPGCEMQSYSCSDERTSGLHREDIKPDVIMIFMGINDWGCGARLFPYKEQADISVFATAYECMLEKLRKNYPLAEIWCFTLPISARENGEIYPYYITGVHIGEFCDVIIASAEKYGCKIIDLYRNAEPYGSVDGFHPSSQGMKTLAQAVIEETERK